MLEKCALRQLLYRVIAAMNEASQTRGARILAIGADVRGFMALRDDLIDAHDVLVIEEKPDA